MLYVLFEAAPPGKKQLHVQDVCSNHFHPVLDEICDVQELNKQDINGKWVELKEETFLHLMYKLEQNEEHLRGSHFLIPELFYKAYGQYLPVMMHIDW